MNESVHFGFQVICFDELGVLCPRPFSLSCEHKDLPSLTLSGGRKRNHQRTADCRNLECSCPFYADLFALYNTAGMDGLQTFDAVRFRPALSERPLTSTSFENSLDLFLRLVFIN